MHEIQDNDIKREIRFPVFLCIRNKLVGANWIIS